MTHSPSKHGLICLATLTTVLCWNGSTVDSTNKNKRQDTNFYGTILDYATPNPANVEDIAIADKDTFAVYQTVKDIKTACEKSSDKNIKTDMDPKQNKSLLDLHEISMIESRNQEHPTASEIEINNRKYIEIDVTFINGNKQTYLVESTREVSCLKVDKSADNNSTPILEKRKLNMIHVKNLTIKGYKSAKDTSKNHDDNQVSKKAEIAGATEKIIDQLEENVKNLPKDNSSQYDKIRSTMLSLLRSLREQLQKMLNMLKN
ncbi:MAG: hypothetical protein NTU89_00375 [Candidatus Dependentiae bacterium]|nr:hypothetical protein [Candidatus Dependentiae bacterium]